MEKNKYFIQDGMISKFDFMDNQEFYPLTTLCSMLNDNDEKYDKLAKKFVIVSKALELACDYLVSTSDDELFDLVKDIYNDDEYLATKISYFIGKAKETIEGE